MNNLFELRDYNNFSKIDALSAQEKHEWYLVIKKSLRKLSEIYSETEIRELQLAILKYEQRISNNEN